METTVAEGGVERKVTCGPCLHEAPLLRVEQHLQRKEGPVSTGLVLVSLPHDPAPLWKLLLLMYEAQ